MSDRGAPGAGRGAPLVLAFDTTGSACSVAVGRGGDALAHERCEMRHGHAEALLPMIDRVVRRAGVAPAAVDVVAVSSGPGGFTGIRAGLAAAQGVALAARARLAGVTTFAAVAAVVPLAGTPLLVALDSRRADLYVQIFGAGGGMIGEPAAVLPGDLAGFVAGALGETPLRIAGDAAEAAAGALAGRAVDVLSGSPPDAAGVLAAAAAAGFAETPVRARYLRPPDVSLPKARRSGAGAA
jgi:tRNA threonylcarbamoyladenosine biosynthesis protein TsaB